MRKLGICIMGSTIEEIQTNIALAKNVGFTSTFTQGKTLEIVELSSRVAIESGLEVDNIHAPFDGINNMWLDNAEGEDIFARQKRIVEVCASYGIKKTVVHISSGWSVPPMNDLGFSRYDNLVEFAAQKGVSIAFENLRKPGNLGALMERYEQVENVGFCWDAGHELCYTPRWEFLPLYGHKTICVHLHDNLAIRAGDLHMLPFDGKRDWSRAAALLKGSAYNGPIMLEAWHDLRFYNDLSSQDFYDRAYAVAFKIAEMVEQ